MPDLLPRATLIFFFFCRYMLFFFHVTMPDDATRYVRRHA